MNLLASDLLSDVLRASTEELAAEAIVSDVKAEAAQTIIADDLHVDTTGLVEVCRGCCYDRRIGRLAPVDRAISHHNRFLSSNSLILVSLLFHEQESDSLLESSPTSAPSNMESSIEVINQCIQISISINAIADQLCYCYSPYSLI